MRCSLLASREASYASTVTPSTTGRPGRRAANRREGQPSNRCGGGAEMDVMLRLDGIFRNVRYAIRAAVRAPAFTATVVLTLALGIGANSAVFSAIDAVLLQPLGFPHADRLVQLAQTQDQSAETNIAPIRLEDWNRMSTAFESMTGYYVEDVSETSGEFPERLRRAWVAPRFVETWGTAPQFGRSFTDAEHAEGGSPAVLISDGY